MSSKELKKRTFSDLYDGDDDNNETDYSTDDSARALSPKTLPYLKRDVTPEKKRKNKNNDKPLKIQESQESISSISSEDSLLTNMDKMSLENNKKNSGGKIIHKKTKRKRSRKYKKSIKCKNLKRCSQKKCCKNGRNKRKTRRKGGVEPNKLDLNITDAYGKKLYVPIVDVNGNKEYANTGIFAEIRSNGNVPVINDRFDFDIIALESKKGGKSTRKTKKRK